MKFLKYLFLLLLIVFVGGAIYYATKDGSYEITQSKTIDAPASVIFEQVSNYRNWEDWSPRKQEDPTMVFSLQDSTGVGAGFSYNGKDADGSRRITALIPAQKMTEEVTFDSPMGEREAQSTWTFKKAGEEGTVVTWKLTGEHPILDRAYYDLFGGDFDGKIANTYTQGLETLATEVKEKMAVYSILVDGITQHSGGFYMHATSAVKQQVMGARVKALLGTVAQYMRDQNIDASGKAMTVYNERNPAQGTAIISSGYPVSTRVITPEASTVLTGYMPTQTVIKVTLKGDYKNMEEAWEAGMQYLNDQGFIQPEDSNAFEVYLNDPDATPNPANLKTNLFIPANAPDTL
ncbi:MAG: SRPBCC family protein [Leeuwenhoekiella sp.]